MKISAIIPAYNAGKYIRDALDSVLNQTYKEIEIIVVDDGSTDGTQEIVLRHYPSVRYFFQKNGGVAKARNRALREAQGVWVAFLDADDVWCADKIEKQVAHIETHPGVAWVVTNQVYFDEIGITGHDPWKGERLFTGDLVKNLFTCSGITPSTIMVKRTVLEEVGYFEEGLRVGEDDNLWMRIAMRHPAAFIDEPLVMYRHTPGSLTSGGEGLFHGIREHIELLYAKYPDIVARLGVSLIEEKQAQLYRDKGNGHFGRNELKEARRAYQKSLQYRPWNPRVFFYWCCSLLPVWLVAGLRVVKRTGAHTEPRHPAASRHASQA